MQQTETIHQRAGTTAMRHKPAFRRFLLVYTVLLLLLLTALAVPLININRFQRRTAASLSESLGRPVHFDRISLTLLPWPGLTIENLSVSEDPSFGAEPFIRASVVRATLRVSSLWRRRVEFTRISFTDPSINLVKAQGRWNLESILLQAARIDAAPTAQSRPSATPRFPYIEATGARLNLKLGQEKTPFSLTEADCALWLANPNEWRLRLEGRPMRTDTSVSQTGSFQVEGTLGRARRLNDVPLDLRATWRGVPLGEASRVILGRDAGLRGSMTLSATARGTIETGTVEASLHLAEVRRADFVPARTLSLDAECQATQAASFHTLNEIRCSWPPPFTPGAKTLALTGSLPDVRQPSSFAAQIGTPGIPAATLIDWLRIASPRIAPSLQATGLLTGTALLDPTAALGAPWTGQFVLSGATLTLPTVAPGPIFSGNVTLRSTPAGQFVLSPLALDLGDHEAATLDGRFNPAGYTLRLTGTATEAKLLAFAAALPQIGDGLSDTLPAEDDSPLRFDLTSDRSWGGDRTWHTSAPASPHASPHRKRTRSR